MLTAKNIKTLTTLTPTALTRIIRDSGYKCDKFTESKFLGITTGNQFCYRVKYLDLDNNQCSTKVFITYNTASDIVYADY
jgi:hypothetical protein